MKRVAGVRHRPLWSSFGPVMKIWYYLFYPLDGMFFCGNVGLFLLFSVL